MRKNWKAQRPRIDRQADCHSLESVIKLAERFIAGVTKPRPAAQAEVTPAPTAEPVAA